MHLPASPLMHGTGGFSSFQAMLVGAAHRDARRAATSTRTSCGRPCSASASRRWRSSATRSPSRWSARSKRPKPRATPYDISSLQLIISSGVMWSTGDEAGAHGARQHHLLRLARLERGRGLRGLDQRARIGAHDRQVHDRQRHQGVHRRRARGRARLRRGRHARGRRQHPGRLLQGRAQVARDVPRDQRRSAGRCPATSRASKPTARSCCSAAARSSSTPAARRCSPRRSRRP